MTIKQAYLALIALTLLFSVCFVSFSNIDAPSASAQETNTISPFQETEPDNISVSLLSPAHNATISSGYNCSFIFVPAINGTDHFLGASLVVNGSVVTTNQTAITAYQNNTIYYKFPSNGTYTWNIGIQNTTNVVWAPADFNLTVAVPDKIAVNLLSPANATTVKDDFNCSFVFVPTVDGTDKFTKATLLVNGSEVATNQTAIVAGQNNTIYYKFANNGTYYWNIRLQSESFTVTAPSNYNFTVAVYVAPSPTATPTVTPTPTVEPTATPTPTPSPTPVPTEPISTWLILIIAVVVICVILAVVLVMLRRPKKQ